MAETIDRPGPSEPVRRASAPTELIKRVEEASMNAWPASHQLLLDGWLIRLSNGFTKRANCVVPLYQPQSTQPDHLLQKIRYCENLYAREQLRTVFRLSSHPDNQALDRHLKERGYNLLDSTRVQVLELQHHRSPIADSQTTFQRIPADDWLKVYASLAAMPVGSRDLHAGLVRAIRPDCAFGVLLKDGQPIACALGVLEHDMLGLFDVITAPAHRNQGHASQLLAQLLAWGANQGAKQAYLQVIATNAPALHVYARLGFGNLYSYWYRQTS